MDNRVKTVFREGLNGMYYWKTQANEDCFLVLEPCDWTEEEWKVLTKVFGCAEAERIVVRNYILEVYGVPTEAMREILEREKEEI